MNRKNFYSIDTFKLLSVFCFLVFMIGLPGTVGTVIRFGCSFSIPFLFMTFGFLTLPHEENRKDILARSIKRNAISCAAWGILFALLSIVYIFFGCGGLRQGGVLYSLDYVRAFFYGKNPLTLAFRFLVLNEWQLPIGTYMWFGFSLLYAEVLFFLLDKTGLMKKKWFEGTLLIVSFTAGLLFGEFSEVFGLPEAGLCFFMQAVPYMLIGKMLKDRSEKIRKIKLVIPFILIVGGFILSYIEVVSLRVFDSFALATSGVYFHNYIGSVVTAIGLIMFSICFRHLGKRSNLALMGGMAAPWMYILSEPIAIIIRHFIGSDSDLFSLFAVAILSFLSALFLSYIISLIKNDDDTAETEKDEKNADAVISTSEVKETEAVDIK